MPHVARNTCIGIGEESTFGVPVSRTNYRPLISMGLQRTRTYEQVDDLQVSAGGSSLNRHTPIREEVSGSLDFYASYTRMGMFLKHCFGGAASAGAGPYNHTYSPAALPTGLTAEAIRGSGSSEVFNGVKVGSWSLSVQPAQGQNKMTLSLDLIGKSSGGRVTAGSPTYGASDDFVLGHQAGQISWNSVNYSFRRLTVNASNGLETRFQSGSETTDAPSEAGVRTYTIEAEMEMNDENLSAAFLADTVADFSVSFTGTGNNALQIQGFNCYISSYDDTISGQGIVMRRITWRCQADSSDPALRMIVSNDSASATVN